MLSLSTGRTNGVVPFPVELMRFDVHERELCIRNAAALGIDPLVKTTANQQAALRRCRRDQAYDHLVALLKRNRPRPRLDDMDRLA